MYKFIYMSIDPGTSMLGTTINAITLDDQWVVLHTTTTNVKALVQHYFSAHQLDLHGERFFKSRLCGQVIFKFAEHWNVNRIISESPYMGKFAQAFSALTECLSSIRNAAYENSHEYPLETIDPATIKNHVGVKGNSGDKEKMREAVRALVGRYIDVDTLDEHAIDSIAVGYTWYRSMWLGLAKQGVR